MEPATVSSVRSAADTPPPVDDIDLTALQGVRWERVRVPDGWEPVATVAREVAEDLTGLTRCVTTCIAAEIDAYAAGVVPVPDLTASVYANLRAILVGLAEHRGPTAEEVAVRRGLGGRRALQGLPIDALIQAYHIGYRELWRRLVEAVPPGDQHTATLLLTAATTVWQWVHEVSDAIARTYAETVRTVEARAVGARQRFVELIVTGDVGGAEAQGLARSLGFDAGGGFVVTAVRGASDALEVVTLQHACEGLDGEHAVVSRGPLVVMVSQGGSSTEVVAAVRDAFPDAAIAVGAARSGLGGARSSLEDAERTLAIVADGASGRFDDEWLWATLEADGSRLAPLLSRGAEVAGTHPHLAEAVTAFAEAGFSVSEASRRLALHANTVAYRLERWEELTGWDPRSFAGLTRSLAALRLRR